MKTQRTTLPQSKWLDRTLNAKGKHNLARKRNIFILMIFVFLMLFICMLFEGCLGSLLNPLPFEGPYSGTVVDISTGRPIAGAKITATWMCWDCPYPHIAEYVVYAHSITDENGYYELNRPRRRGGWFGGDFSLNVHAKEYISAEYYIAPKNLSKPQPFPFSKITALSKFPKVLDVQLQPAKPVFLRLLKSQKATYRLCAAEKLIDLGYTNSDVVTTLVALLKNNRKNNGEKWIQSLAVRTLSKIGHNARVALPVLDNMLRKEKTDKYLQLEIESAIKKINSNSENNN